MASLILGLGLLAYEQGKKANTKRKAKKAEKRRMALEEDDRREWEQQERLSVGRDYKRQGRDAVGAPPSYEQATSPDVGGGEKGTMRRRRRSSTDSARSDTVR